MAHLLYLKLVCLLLFFFSSASYPQQTPNIIHEACKASQSSQACEDRLSHSGSYLPPNATVLEAIKFALNLTTNSINKGRAIVKTILTASRGNKNLSNAATGCLAMLDYSKYRINMVGRALTSRKHMKDARAWMSAALVYQYDCWSGLKQVNGTHIVAGTKDFFNSTLIQGSSSALGMIVNYDIYGEKTKLWRPTQTERDGYWEPVSSSPGSGLTTTLQAGLKENVTVCKGGGRCRYKTVQEAVDVSPNNTLPGKWFVIRIGAGVYEETVRVSLEKKNVVFWGDGMGKTVIIGSKNVGQQGMSTFFSATVAAQTGICYGRIADNLPTPSDVVALCNQNNIRRMRIYDPDQSVLQALRGSNIELMLGVPNPDLQYVATSQANANSWVQKNVRAYPTVRFRYIAVGNKVSPLRSDTSQYVRFVLPALQNIQNAISNAGLGNQIRVSTAIETGLLGNTYPPANGVFNSSVTSYINPIITFLVNNRAPLLANIYPYFSYIYNKTQIDLRYALFTFEGVVAGGVRYQNLFYAILDALYAALEKSGGSSLEIVVSESGWPSAGGDSTTVDNARTYNTNLIRRVKSGTPKRPNRAIETYIFALFDENRKSPEYERHFGIFFPNRQHKYPISF